VSLPPVYGPQQIEWCDYLWKLLKKGLNVNNDTGIFYLKRRLASHLGAAGTHDWEAFLALSCDI